MKRRKKRKSINYLFILLISFSSFARLLAFFLLPNANSVKNELFLVLLLLSFLLFPLVRYFTHSLPACLPACRPGIETDSVVQSSFKQSTLSFLSFKMSSHLVSPIRSNATRRSPAQFYFCFFANKKKENENENKNETTAQNSF